MRFIFTRILKSSKPPTNTMARAYLHQLVPFRHLFIAVQSPRSSVSFTNLHCSDTYSAVQSPSFRRLVHQLEIYRHSFTAVQSPRSGVSFTKASVLLWRPTASAINRRRGNEKEQQAINQSAIQRLCHPARPCSSTGDVTGTCPCGEVAMSDK